MSFNFAHFLLNTTNEFNQHKSTEISGMSVEQALEICKELEMYTKHSHIFCVEVYVDNSWSIIQKGYFNEHPDGHEDRVVLGSDGVKNES